MATQNLAVALAEILRHEGGYVDHPSDPGGATNMGITRKTLARWRRINPWWQLPKLEVKSLSRTEAKAIYKALYWDRIGANKLPPGIDVAIFDFAVNSGPNRAVKVLQRVLGVAADGIVGPKTLATLDGLASRTRISEIVKMVGKQRMSFLRRLRTFSVFGKGWTRRVRAVERRALELARTQLKEIPNINTSKRKPPMDILSGYKTYIVGIVMLLVGIGQALGVDLPGFDGQSASHLIMEGFAIVFLRKGLKTEIGNA